MPVEDFTTYTEVDPNSSLSVAASKITFTDVLRIEESYVAKDMGAGHFSGDFEHLLTYNCATSEYGRIAAWALANLLDGYQDIEDGGGDELAVGVYGGYNNQVLDLIEVFSGTQYTDQFDSANGTTYYLKIKRDEAVGANGTLYCYIYSDAERTNLLDTLTLALHEKEDFRYIYGVQSWDSEGGPTISGFTENLDLQEGAATYQQTVAMDTLLRALSVTGTVALDSIIGGVGIQTVDLDALCKGDALQTVALDGHILAQADTETVSLDMLVDIPVSNDTVIESIALHAAIENISVIVQFARDANENNSVVLEYRETPAGSWIEGIPMTVDRRDYLYEYPLAGEEDNNPIVNSWKNQYRAVIFGLTPNTEYEVRVTFTDADGVFGTNPISDTITTRNDNPTSSGTTYYVKTDGDDAKDGLSIANAWATIQHAADTVSTGDIVNVLAGTYSEAVILTADGTASNPITFRSYDLADMAIIDGGSGVRAYGFWARASYNRIKGFQIKDVNGEAPGGCIALGGKGYDGDPIEYGLIVEDCDLVDPGTHWACACIQVRHTEDVLIQRNTMRTTGTGDMREVYGVFFMECQGGAVVKENNITTDGCFKDCVGNLANFRLYSGFGPHGFVYDNIAIGSWDDALEVEGNNMNCAIWGNITKNNDLTSPGGVGMNMSMGVASTIVGPCYVIRNVFIDAGDVTIKLGSSSYGDIFFYHNTVYSTRGGGGIGFFGNNALVDNLHSRNNIILLTGGRLCENWDSTADRDLNDFDYDAMWTNREASGFSWAWHRIPYSVFLEFQAATGHEEHGFLCEDPKFINAASDDFRLMATSPCINEGVELQGFNTADSPWPSSGSGPDVGAFEYALDEKVVRMDTFLSELDAETADLDLVLSGRITSQTAALSVLTKYLEETAQVDLNTLLEYWGETQTVAVSSLLEALDAKTLTLDARFRGKVPKTALLDLLLGIEVSGWISPTGHNDPSAAWWYEEDAYDDNLATAAGTNTQIAQGAWSEFLILTRASILCTKLRFNSIVPSGNTYQIDIDVFVENSWVDVYQGDFVSSVWVEKTFSQVELTQARVRLYNMSGPSAYGNLVEFDFWAVAPAKLTSVNPDIFLEATDLKTADLDARVVDRFTSAVNLSALAVSLGVGELVALDVWIGLAFQVVDLDTLLAVIANTDTVDLDVLLGSVLSKTANLDSRLVARPDSSVALDLMIGEPRIVSGVTTERPPHTVRMGYRGGGRKW